MSPESIEPLTQFGAAGLMGALWIWERLLSRRRERQRPDQSTSTGLPKRAVMVAPLSSTSSHTRSVSRILFSSRM